MRNFILFGVLVLAHFFVFSGTASAQKEQRLNSSPKAFRTFFAKFRAAVEKSDKRQVSAMTRFPLKYGFDAGDEGTMTKTQFVKRFGEIFGDNPREFLPERNPLFSRGDGGSYIVSTDDAAHFIFVKRGTVFKLIAYLVEP